MKIGIPKERHPKEKRVAASPETVKKLVGMGMEVLVEHDAGHDSMMIDKDYEEAGARIRPDAAGIFGEADVILKVQRPLTAPAIDLDEMALLRLGQTLLGKLDVLANTEQVHAYADRGVNAFALELAPRITRAQNIDILSSQSNLAGYRAVIDAANHFGRIFPMMMTAAGTITPARVLVLGAGVAGLQAIATAKRLGAAVSAFDVRSAVKEQVESLGAEFIEVPSEEPEPGETAGGYARKMSEEYQRKQEEIIHENIKKMDIVITTALIPGKPAPVLVNEEMVKDMKPGSVIVDLAAEAGGNCPLSEMDKVVTAHDVAILSYENIPSRIPGVASSLFARNLLNFIALLIDEETRTLKFDMADEIIQGTLVTHNGQIIHPAFQEGGN
ncbi:MAG: Re/Si-specific NAD(P)(+) transhydrogenase subunit alpha [Planctomycetota bacterium]